MSDLAKFGATKAARVAHFRKMLGTVQKWACRGLLAIYKYQTAAEKAVQETRELNGVGFSGCDAEILSSFAEQYSRRGWLSEKQLAILHRKMPKYAKQLLKVAEGTI
jgi:hypothetical protein